MVIRYHLPQTEFIIIWRVMTEQSGATDLSSGVSGEQSVGLSTRLDTCILKQDT